MGRLEGKVAVITGAASGIGRETASLFSEEGARVCIADVTEEAGEQTASERRDAFLFRADVTSPGSVEQMYRATAERYGGIDVLYNNAGIMPEDDASILEMEPDAWQRVQDVNAKGVFTVRAGAGLGPAAGRSRTPRAGRTGVACSRPRPRRTYRNPAGDEARRGSDRQVTDCYLRFEARKWLSRAPGDVRPRARRRASPGTAPAPTRRRAGASGTARRSRARSRASAGPSGAATPSGRSGCGARSAR